MSQKALTLSLIIPAYNEENHLKACLEAIASQTVMPDEVIVVDNNSTDKTLQIAAQYSFVTIIKEKRQGLYFSRRRGLNSAKSDILGRIDADTIIESGWVQTVKTAFKDTAVQAISGPVGYHDMPFPNFTQEVENQFLKLAQIGNYHFLMGANMAIRRSVWQSIGPELCNQPFIFEDIDLAIHLNANHIQPSYQPQMKALVSARRFNDSLTDFRYYISGHSRTLAYHNQSVPAGARMAEMVFMAFYIGVKPLHMTFDPVLRRPSLDYLLKRPESRPDPMMVN